MRAENYFQSKPRGTGARRSGPIQYAMRERCTPRPPKPKVEYQTLRRLGVSDLQTQCKWKGCNPYTTKLTPTSIGLRLSSQRNGSQEGSHPWTRSRVVAKIDDRVLQQRCRPIDPDLRQRLGHIVRYETARGLKHGLAIRRTRPHYSLVRVSLGVLTERLTLCG